MILPQEVRFLYCNVGSQDPFAADILGDQAFSVAAQPYGALGAAVRFVKGGKGRKAIITDLDKAIDAVKGKTGTVIY